MFKPDVIIRLVTKDDTNALCALNKKAFGPGRFARTAYRVREQAAAEPRLHFGAELGGALIGAVQLTPLTVGGKEGALLLGPLVIDERYKNQGFGLKLMVAAMEQATALGYQLVLLVGDEPYYARAGFRRAPYGQILMPGPVDYARFLYKELRASALSTFSGSMRGAPETLPESQPSSLTAWRQAV